MRLDQWIERIQNHKTRSFGVAFVLIIITALGMRPSSACLITQDTPMAIVDLELAFDQLRAESIKEIWKNRICNGALSISSNATEAAVVNIILDYAFIAAYVWFLIVLFVLTIPRHVISIAKATKVACYVAIVAGGLDVVENLFMILFLMKVKINSLLFAIPASVKFALIAILILWILVRLLRKLIFSVNS